MDEIDKCQGLASWLILVHAPGLSPAKLIRLIDCFKTPESIIEADPALLAEYGLGPKSIDYFKHPEWDSLEADLTWLEIPRNHFISILDRQYPVLLRNIPDPPPGLFVSGNVEVINHIQIAIVGTRKPTPGGRRNAMGFSAQLCNRGITVTSGLATGIDTAAHEAAIASGNPTVAVMGNGLDTVYPWSNRELAEKICNNGALVSEFPVKTKPLPAHFPRRNRIISGLCVGTLVVEAAIKSGSLITARLAIEQGREVFAVPGSIHNPMSAGCHSLISDGAKLTANIDDILEEIGPLSFVAGQCEPGLILQPGVNERLDEGSKLLLDNIGYEPVTIDQLVTETGLQVNNVSVILLELELLGLVDTLPGGRFTRK